MSCKITEQGIIRDKTKEKNIVKVTAGLFVFFRVKKILAPFFIMFVMLAAVSCERTYTKLVVTADSYELDYQMNHSRGSKTLRKGDTLLYLDSSIDQVWGRQYLVEYQGVRGWITEGNFEWTSEIITNGGKEAAGPMILKRGGRFFNMILTLLSFVLASFIVLFLGSLIGLIPYVGKFLRILILLPVLALWVVIVIDIFRIGRIAEIIFTLAFLMICMFSPPARKYVWGVFIKVE